MQKTFFVLNDCDLEDKIIDYCASHKLGFSRANILDCGLDILRQVLLDDYFGIKTTCTATHVYKEETKVICLRTKVKASNS